MQKLREWLVPLAYFSNNLISRVGIFVVTAAGILWILLFPQLFTGTAANPYAGLLMFVGLPTLFLGGLALIPVGVFFARRRAQASGDDQPPVVDFRHPSVRKLTIFILAATCVNIVIASQLSYTAVGYVDSDKFCGETCHQVMTPQGTAHLSSPHSQVGCVECHIGSGAGWFVRYKWDGVGELVSLVTHTFPQPIVPPVENLRPARDICEQCHARDRFLGDRQWVHTTFASDEPNTASTTVLRLKVGGLRAGAWTGIHGAHLNPKNKIEYTYTDRERAAISQVAFTDESGETTLFNSSEAKPGAAGHRRTMDCVDCHNRATHQFDMPDRALDAALADGRINPALPFAKKQALALLQASYPDRDTAAREIASGLKNFYQKSYPQVLAPNIDAAVAAVQAIYARNIYPDMKITWGTYPSHLGHTDSPGCFRCHDGNHTSADGRTISNDCATCHEMPAVDEKDPKVLSDLGVKPMLVASK
jgi:hypothetical protein